MKNTHGGVLLLVKLQASDCYFTKSDTPPWAFFMFFNLYKMYQIAPNTTYMKILKQKNTILNKKEPANIGKNIGSQPLLQIYPNIQIFIIKFDTKTEFNM